MPSDKLSDNYLRVAESGEITIILRFRSHVADTQQVPTRKDTEPVDQGSASSLHLVQPSLEEAALAFVGHE